MAIKDRTKRQREQLRNAVLIAAESIGSSEGWNAVTMRRLAEEIDYTPPMLYELFSGKQGVTSELIKRGFNDMMARFMDIDPQLPAEERLLQMGEAYWQFSQERPGLYQAMFGVGVPCPNGAHPEGLAVFSALVSLIAEIRPKASEEDVHQLAVLTWSAVHGYVSLSMNQKSALAHKNIPIDSLLNNLIKAVQAN